MALRAAMFDFDDVNDLHFRNLNANDKEITKVFHIITADEYRENFSVTDISSAINDGYGYEITVNGTHCDIGGAYKQNSEDEYNVNASNKTMYNWLIEQRFYTENNVKTITKNKYEYMSGYAAAYGITPKIIEKVLAYYKFSRTKISIIYES